MHGQIIRKGQIYTIEKVCLLRHLERITGDKTFISKDIRFGRLF